MEHTFIKVLSHKIKLSVAVAFLAPNLIFAATNKKDEISSELLIKQSIISLIEKNKALEARVESLEKNVFPSSKTDKGEAKNPYTFLDLVQDNLKTKKFTYGKATKNIIARNKPDINGAKVINIASGSKIMVKDLVKDKNGGLWYKLDEGVYVFAENITFWSEK